MGGSSPKSGTFEDFLGDSSRITADMAAGFLLEHPGFLKEALDISLADKPLLSMRAARAVQFAVEKHHELLDPYIDLIFERLFLMKETGAVRSFLKIFSTCPLPPEEKQLGLLLDACFNWLEKPSTPVAIQVYSLEILFRISMVVPDLKPELLMILKSKEDVSSAGIRSRAKDILTRMNTGTRR